MNLSNAERLILHNQYEILSRLSNNEWEQKEFRIRQEILEFGIEGRYEEYVSDSSISASTVPIEVSDEVDEILDMFRIINRCIPNECDKIVFEDFDSLHESEYGIYTGICLKSLGLWRELKVRGNSGHEVLPMYRRMYNTWVNKYDKKIDYLTKEEINDIVNSQYLNKLNK